MEPTAPLRCSDGPVDPEKPYVQVSGGGGGLSHDLTKRLCSGAAPLKKIEKIRRSLQILRNLQGTPCTNEKKWCIMYPQKERGRRYAEKVHFFTALLASVIDAAARTGAGGGRADTRGPAGHRGACGAGGAAGYAPVSGGNR